MLKLGVYRHYKGGLYRVLGVAKHSETYEDMVVYETLYENDLAKLWVRPLTVFMGLVEIGGQSIPRFEYVDEAGPRSQHRQAD